MVLTVRQERRVEISISKEIDALCFKDIHGSNLHAAMVVNSVKIVSSPPTYWREWLNENCAHSFHYDHVRSRIYFASKADLTKFLLEWA